MQSHNLAIMFGPTLFNSGEEKPKKTVGKKTKKDNKKVWVFIFISFIFIGRIIAYSVEFSYGFQHDNARADSRIPFKRAQQV